MNRSRVFESISLCAAIVIVALVIVPSDGLQTFVGVPLRVVSGELAACFVAATGSTARFTDFLLEVEGREPLFVAAECAGLRKFALLLAVALVVARRERVDAIRTWGLLFSASLLTVVGNGVRIAALADLGIAANSQSAIESLLHEIVGGAPLVVAIVALVPLGRKLGEISRARASSRILPNAAPAIVALAWCLLAAARFDDGRIPLADALEAAGAESRVVDARIEIDRFLGRRVSAGREAWGDDRGARVLYERIEDENGRSWPDVHAARFFDAVN